MYVEKDKKLYNNEIFFLCFTLLSIYITLLDGKVSPKVKLPPKTVLVKIRLISKIFFFEMPG